MKIDRSFINRIGDEDKADILLSSLITLVKSLGLIVIAEGVETEIQRQKLLSLNTPFHQGFLYCKPVEVKKLRSAIDHLILT